MAFLLTEIPWWTKLWWRGVDVASDVIKNLISAGTVATVAYLTWEKKKRRELALELEHDRNKKVQEETLARQFATERARTERIAHREERVGRLKAELADLFNRFPTQEATSTYVLFKRYSEWLENSGLLAFGNNLQNLRSWSNRNYFDEEEVPEIREMMKGTEFPNHDNESFLW